MPAKRVDLDERTQASIADYLRQHVYYGQEGIDSEIHGHLVHRLMTARDNLVPWLQQLLDLPTARVLEIGAGTGSSVVAFAEVSAHVDALDILDNHLDIARARVAAHGLSNVSIHCRNATENLSDIAAAPYQMIVFSAALEHMTYAERIASLRMAWHHLAPGGLLVIYETPNRLWFFDAHTSLANFAHWLPDELAIDYASRTPRAGFNCERLTTETLYRWGRGASFHEIEVAIGLANVEVLQSMHEYLAQKFEWYLDQNETPLAKRYRALLAEIEPQLPAPFTEETLNLALRRR